MVSARLPNVFSIDPGTPFLETVAHALCDGTLVEGFSWAGNPLTLADATIYVPTRRAARELRSAFLDVTGRDTVLLPTVRPLGEFDDDLDLFGAGADSLLKIPPAIDPLNRQVLLGRLVLEWTKHLQADARRRYGDETITTPVSTADAFWLAADLAGVLDQLHAEDKSLADVKAATDADVSDWWQVTLAFLEIIGSEWPAILDSRGWIDPADHRNRTLRAEAQRLREAPPDHPIIVAGSTGSIAATAELIQVIATLPKGAVVLPGFDPAMAELFPKKIGTQDITSLVGHPQFGLHQLATMMGVDTKSVTPLGQVKTPGLAARKQWVSESLKPAPVTGDWRRTREDLDGSAFDGVALLEAPSDAMLARAIAVSMREAIKEPEATTALVTPDRTLARRVSVELARHGIMADDSAGIGFSETAQGTLLSMLLQMVFQPDDPAIVLALLKHPLVFLGQSKQAHNMAVTRFEHAILRGGLGRFDPADVAGFVERQLSSVADAKHPPDWLSRFGAQAFETLHDLATRMDAALAPLTALTSQDNDVTVQACVTATILALENLVADNHGNHDALYDGEAGASLETFLAKLVETEPELTFEAAQWPQIVNALSASRTVRFAGAGHPRVFIWGTLEARLQTVDHLILGGLNDGTWPQIISNDAFLTRAQKTGIGMLPPERRIGLSAHDFQMAMGQPSVVLARSLRVDGAPTVPSRWWQRLTTFAGPKTTKSLLARGARLLAMAEVIDPPVISEPAKRPEPKVPSAKRPKSFSVTEIETLRSDPYAIYARKILGLRPTDPLIRDPDASERGTLIHDILERAVLEGVEYSQADAAERLTQIGHACFKDADLPPEVHAVWWSRFEATIGPLLEWERNRADNIKTHHAELKAPGTEVDDTGIRLTGRADRIDERHDGTLDIIDYKTGATPTKTQIKTLQSLQLPLEAALARHGAFEGLGKAETNALVYLKLGPRGVVDDKATLTLDAETDLVSEAWQKTASLLRAYDEENRAYVARMMPSTARFKQDYDHLSRASEWQSGEEGDD